MAIPARFWDGKIAAARDAGLDYEAIGASGTLVIRQPHSRNEIARWAADTLFIVPSRRRELRLGSIGQPDGARVVIAGRDSIARILATLPQLQRRHRAEAGRQMRLAMTATLALAAVIAAYVYGVPVLAGRLVHLVPPAWEASLGETVSQQMEAGFGGDLEVCDPDPQSLANRAIRRFGEAAVAGTGTPFDLDIQVVRSDVPNALALPGGKVYFFSALLNLARTRDEFAGVLAHEIGHVVNRHGMEQLISTAGTGALIGFILGDLTGISVAAGLGTMVIDTRFSRLSEVQADAFAADVAQRMDFHPAGLAELVGRAGADDDFARALALLSTHPLTDDRRAALEIMARERPTGLEPPFTNAEWRAIKAMCDPRPPGKRKGG